MSSAKRQRQRANRQAGVEARSPVEPVSDAELQALLADAPDVTVRADCEHASTRTTADGPVLTRCAVGVSVAGGCPRDCSRFERRRVDGAGLT